ncbi:MAG: 30S ribosomal protein S6 [Propionibacteriaceae bacterium]|nr:30S ribosomal protein S6 [Propionibacteriaceae bacterium]
MRKYEIMIIVTPEMDERQVTPLLERYLKIITDGGGTVDEYDFWGKRRFAYEIQKKAEGFYAVANVTAKPEDVKELDRQLGINEQIMRTKVLRPELHR